MNIPERTSSGTWELWMGGGDGGDPGELVRVTRGRLAGVRMWGYFLLTPGEELRAMASSMAAVRALVDAAGTADGVIDPQALADFQAVDSELREAVLRG